MMNTVSSMRYFRSALVLPLFACVLAFGLAAPGAVAARSQAIQFAPGATSATVEAGAARGENVAYLVTAKEGQSMDVRVTSLEANAVFQIQLPGKAGKFLKGAGEEDDATSWKGVLPQSGTYKIVVGATRGGTDFKLRVEIGK